MKRLFTAVLAIVAFSATSFASNNYSVLEKLNNDKVFRGLTRYLATTGDQDEKLRFVFEESSKKLRKDSDKAMMFNLGNVKAVLTPEQYKKYLVVINMSVVKDSQTEYIAEK